MKITPITQKLYIPVIQQQNNAAPQNRNYQNSTELMPLYNDYLLAFGARVDKGLGRFYDANSERMPETVKTYIENLDDKTKYTPLEAQQNAFEMLTIAEDANDINNIYPEFKKLINPQDSKARRGLIKAVNDFSGILAEDGKGVLLNKENLTIYLAKKVFLEAKTIDEINKDLERDLEPEFKKAFLFHNEDAKFVYTTTLSSLGINPPSSEYRQSLRYTRDGYSDLVGQKISDGQRAFWDSMPDDERTERARKNFNETLSDADKEALHIKRMHNLSNRWKEMSTAERTEYISKMKSGSEPLRYAMIDAWNNNIDLIKALSTHLKENQIYKTADLLYSTQEFSQFQSEVMSEFWAKNPDMAEHFGESIRNSNTKIQDAIANGTFEDLKRQIACDKNQRIKELEAFKKTTIQQISTTETDYMQEFKEAYMNEPHAKANMKYMPQAYIDDYFTVIEDGYSRESIEAWTKNLKGEPISDEEFKLLKQISSTEPPKGIRINRAIEAAMANVLYECTNNPDVFRFSHSDGKTAIAQIDRGEKEIFITSHKEQETFRMPLVKRKINKNRIAALYRTYKEDLSADEVYRIATSFFAVKDPNAQEALENYIDSFGKSAHIIFSERSIFPKLVKERMYKKFADHMPPQLYENVICHFDNTIDPFGREAKIKHINYGISKRFDFVPAVIMEKYLDAVGYFLRTPPQVNLDAFETKACTKRKDPKATAGLAILDKSNMNASNKLKLLAAEQVLAESLYDSTKNPEVFALHFEELCDNIEVFNMVKKFPSETRNFPARGFQESIALTANKKIDLKNLAEEFIACTNDVTDNWLNSEVKHNGIGRLSTLVENLAGSENNPKILEYIAQRIKHYNLRLR